MTTENENTPVWLEKGWLSAVDARVLGALMEKSMATPDYYPMTLNSLVAACNQKSNREPVMALSETEVQQAVDRLRYERRWISQVTTSGSRAAKYRHELLNTFNLKPGEQAILCELFLRGPQTPGELKIHAERMCPFPEAASFDAALHELASWQPHPLVVCLPRKPGQREARYAHTLSGEVPAGAELEPAAVSDDSLAARMSALEEKVRTLENTVAGLMKPPM